MTEVKKIIALIEKTEKELHEELVRCQDVYGNQSRIFKRASIEWATVFDLYRAIKEIE